MDIDSREYAEAYLAEEAEYEAGIHPMQVRERIEKALYDKMIFHKDITFLDWNIDGPRVKVDLDHKYFGVFNYETNEFE